MSLATPDQIRSFQRKLYQKAKQEPAQGAILRHEPAAHRQEPAGLGRRTAAGRTAGPDPFYWTRKTLEPGEGILPSYRMRNIPFPLISNCQAIN